MKSATTELEGDLAQRQAEPRAADKLPTSG